MSMLLLIEKGKIETARLLILLQHKRDLSQDYRGHGSYSYLSSSKAAQYGQWVSRKSYG